MIGVLVLEAAAAIVYDLISAGMDCVPPTDVSVGAQVLLDSSNSQQSGTEPEGRC